MFTWICPQCGREVPPSYDECPDCAKRNQATAAAVAPPPVPAPVPAAPPPQQQYQAPPQQYQPAPPAYPPPPQQQYPPAQQQYPPQQYAPQQYPPQQYPPQQYPPQQYPPQQYPAQQYPPPYQQQPPQQQQPQEPAPPPFYPPEEPKAGLPTWLLTILCALGFGVIVLGAYYLIGTKKDTASAKDSATTLENVPAAGARNSPLAKQVEVVGVRLTQNKAKKTEARFLLVNHTGGDIPDFQGNVVLAARTRKKDEEPIGSFSFQAPTLGPYESKEITALVDTKLKVYELPDWQNLQAQLEFTSQ